MMDDKTRELVDAILAQNDKIIDAMMTTQNKEAFDVLCMMLDNSAVVLDALFPQVRFVTMAEQEEPPMMQ